jgi:hypothetical protein
MCINSLRAEGDANGAKNYFRILLQFGIGGATVSRSRTCASIWGIIVDDFMCNFQLILLILSLKHVERHKISSFYFSFQFASILSVIFHYFFCL